MEEEKKRVIMMMMMMMMMMIMFIGEPCELSNDHFTQTIILSEIFSFLHFINYSDVDESFINRCHFIKEVLPESSLNNHMGLLQSSNDGSSNACQAQKSLFIESKSELKA